MSLLASNLTRQAMLGSRTVSVRNIHIENTVGNNMPFKYKGQPKAFAVKLALFMAGGFSIPFLATMFQLRKSAATTD